MTKLERFIRVVDECIKEDGFLNVVSALELIAIVKEQQSALNRVRDGGVLLGVLADSETRMLEMCKLAGNCQRRIEEEILK